ncbi:hypothetical protein [Polyangium spumosum]|uniref:Uncharacterized protein n=1 Tax=Polyangium spumosum TaxID=889282 RepID=A0A6N7PY19_9BACT|nr:hypothetical protein [Polyangium spumosum]MRG95776.1 hypothetical protein [Polyangium spumosum]
MVGDELAFCKAGDRLFLDALKEKLSFTEAVDAFRRLEAEFVARAGDDEWDVRETRRRIAEYILRVADAHHPPFEVCRQAWNDVIRLGFSDKYIECVMTWYFADCCRYDENPEEGLAVLLPLIAELERGLEEARATQSSMEEFYEYHLEPLLKIRDELLAQQRGEQIPGKSTRRIDEA